jgi:hypothetical protein
MSNVSEMSGATSVNRSTWGYSAPVGEWIVNMALPDSSRATSLSPLWHVLQLVQPRVISLHRLRKATVSWGGFDPNGEEREFHELVEIEAVAWPSLHQRLEELLHGPHLVAVSALFLELDTWVIDDASATDVGTWVESSAELQVSFLAPELRPIQATLMYSTAIDVWLPTTYDQRFGARSNSKMSAANLPRLEAFLSTLSALAGTPLTLGQSKLYADALSQTGFREAYRLANR